MPRFRAAITSWRAGVEPEVEFWTKWFDTKGLLWPKEFEARLAPRPLKPAVAALLPAAPAKARVLDVGSGPISNIGNLLEGRDLEVIATDPLASMYAAIAGRHGVTPPIPTVFAFAEDLSSRFDAESFDVVTCNNALDHAIEPVWGIIEMLIITRPGGTVWLNHRCNEAEHENYAGFHQWNFDERDCHFIVWNKDRSINVNQVLATSGIVRCERQDDRLIVSITRADTLPFDINQYHRRMRAGLLEAMLYSHLADANRQGEPGRRPIAAIKTLAHKVVRKVRRALSR